VPLGKLRYALRIVIIVRQAWRMDDNPNPTPLCVLLRQACAAELTRALELLSDANGDRDAAVHESRKCVRRVRAWLRLGHRQRRRSLAGVDLQLRALRRTLGPLRDGASRIEALNRLRKRPELADMRALLTQARAQLIENLGKRWARRPRHGGSWQRLLQGLRDLLAGIDQWPLDGLTRVELNRALRRSFLRACKARRANAGRSAAVQRHAWRGLVRILLLQSQWLETCALAEPSPQLKRLAQSLGNENDLALVSRVLGELELAQSMRAALRRQVQQQRRELAKRNDARAATLLRWGLAPSRVK